MAANEQWLKTFCGFCHANCGMKVLVNGGRIERVMGDPEFPGSRGYLCPKGMSAAGIVYSPHRLKYPLIRRNGGFERVSWNSVLDTLAEKLNKIKENDGPESVMQVRGSPTTEVVRDGFVQLMATFGSPNVTGPSHLCSTPRILGQKLVSGGQVVPDLKRAECIVIWGANPNDSRNYSEHFIHERFFTVIPAAKKRGAKLIVIDPRRTKLAAIADEWVNIAVGTDLAFGLSLLNVIIGEQLYDPEFVHNWTVGFDRLSQHVQEMTPEWAEKITKVPVDTIRRVARIYSTTKPATILDGNGLDQHPNVVQTVRLTTMLSALTGNMDIPGGNVLITKPETAPYPSLRPAINHLAFESIPLFPRVTMPFLIDAVLTGKPYTPRALITYHANPLLINANYKRVRQALEKLELIVVNDILPCATADIAHIILPDTSDFERHGYGAWPRFEGGYVALQQKVIEPVGESRSIFEVEYELATRLGLQHQYPWTTNEEWIDYKLKPLNVTFNKLQQEHVIDVTPGPAYKKYNTRGFKTDSGKVELYSRTLKNCGQDPIPVYRPFEEGHELQKKYPLIGTTKRPGNYVHTRFRDVDFLRKIQPDALLRLHPKDAELRNIGNGEQVTVASPEGSISVRTMISDEIRAGFVIVDFGWGNSWDGGPNVNILTSDYPRCPLSGATPNRRFRCEISKSSDL